MTELPAPTPFAPPRDLVRSVRFDVGYYYGQGKSASQLAEELTTFVGEQGHQSGLLLRLQPGLRGSVLYAVLEAGAGGLRATGPAEASAARGASRGASRSSPGSTDRRASRCGRRIATGVRRPRTARTTAPTRDSYPLCVHNPQVVQWWLGLIGDLLDRYPDLDGVDIAEAQIDLWGDTACHCEHCQSRPRGRRSDAGVAHATGGGPDRVHPGHEPTGAKPREGVAPHRRLHRPAGRSADDLRRHPRRHRLRPAVHPRQPRSAGRHPGRADLAAVGGALRQLQFLLPLLDGGGGAAGEGDRGRALLA